MVLVLNTPWALIWPSFMILITVIGFYLLGEELTSSFNDSLLVKIAEGLGIEFEDLFEI